MKTETSPRQPAESSLPSYHHVQAEARERSIVAPRPAVRWVKVAWLASLYSHRVLTVRDAVKAALHAIDNDNAAGLVAALRVIEADGWYPETQRLAGDAADTVESAIREQGRS